MKVELITHTPNPEHVIAAAARLCYSPVGVCDILENQSDEKASSFVEMLVGMGHGSALEHCTFTFGIEGISRITETQLVRHRMASYSVQSGRYVKRDNPEFITPKMIAENEHANEIYQQALNETMRAYNELADLLLEQQAHEYCEKKGIEFTSLEDFKAEHKRMYSKFEKVAIENARYVYPQALATKLVVTMNVRSLLNFFAHRTCRRAQDEIQEMAWQMRALVAEVAPTLAKHMGPSCFTEKKCHEGKMTCGRVVTQEEIDAKGSVK